MGTKTKKGCASNIDCQSHTTKSTESAGGSVCAAGGPRLIAFVVVVVVKPDDPLQAAAEFEQGRPGGGEGLECPRMSGHYPPPPKGVCACLSVGRNFPKNWRCWPSGGECVG